MSIQTPGQMAAGGAGRKTDSSGNSRNPETNGASRVNKLYFAVWRWHFYAGLYVIPFILLLSVTGIVMVWFSAFVPEYGERLTVSGGAELPLVAQAEAAAKHAGGTVDQYIAPYAPENPAMFRVQTEGGARILALDPATGDVLRDTVEGATWNEWTDNLHGELLMKGAAKGELKRVAMFHHAVSAAAYQLKHKVQDPQKTPESLDATTIAGLEGVLRAYENMLPAHPVIRSAELDEALAARDKGTLAQFVGRLPPMPRR